MHRHDELEVNLMVRGRGSYLIDDRKYELSRCIQVWLFPEQNHVLLEYSPDFEMWVLVFRPAMVRRVCTIPATALLRETNPAGHFYKQLSEEQARRLNSLFREIAATRADAPRHNAGLAYALLSAWAMQQAAEPVPAGAEIHPAVEKTVHLLRNETTPLPFAELAQRAGLSPSQLSRVFQRQTGMPIYEFRNRQRIERFLTLYGEGQRTKMMDAALEAGFGSYPQFYRVFKQIMGCSPADYRRRYR
jgi:AraC-like DNA-binding protein